MQYLPWILILVLIYAIYFLMLRYEKHIKILENLIEQNRNNIKENRKLIESYKHILEKSLQNDKIKSK